MPPKRKPTPEEEAARRRQEERRVYYERRRRELQNNDHFTTGRQPLMSNGIPYVPRVDDPTEEQIRNRMFGPRPPPRIRLTNDRMPDVTFDDALPDLLTEMIDERDEATLRDRIREDEEPTTTATSTMSSISNLINSTLDTLTGTYPNETVPNELPSSYYSSVSISDESMDEEREIPVNSIVEEVAEKAGIFIETLPLSLGNVTRVAPIGIGPDTLANPVLYRVIDHSRMEEYNRLSNPEEFPTAQSFQNAIRYHPQTSPGTLTVTNVICVTLNNTLDTSQIRHTFNGRFHVLLGSPYPVDDTHLFNAPDEKITLPDGQSISLPSYLSNTIDFSIVALRETRFATLTINANDYTHSQLGDPIDTCTYWFINLIKTGALGGQDLPLVLTHYSRVKLCITSRGGRNNRQFSPVYLSWQDLDSLFDANNDVQGQIQHTWQQEYLDHVHMLFDRNEENYEEDDFEELRNDDQAIVRRIEKITFKLMPRTLFVNKAIDVSAYPRVFIQNETSLAANPIQHVPDTTHALASTFRDINHPNHLREDLRLGCITDHTNKLETALSRLSQLWSPPNNLLNDCFIDCLRESTTRKFTSRLDFDIKHGNHINENEMFQIAQQREEVYYLYGIQETQYHEKTLAMQKDPEEARISQRISFLRCVNGDHQNPVEKHHFLVHHSHCYLIKGLQLLLKKVKCSTCSQWINRETFRKHIDSCSYCPQCRRAYHSTPHICRDKAYIPEERFRAEKLEEATERLNQRLCKPTNTNSYTWVRMQTSPLGKKITPANKIWLADMEAYPDELDEFTPYAVGLVNLSNVDDTTKVEIFYGEHCMRDYFKRLDEIQGTIYYYNGSGFDNFLHLRHMVEEDRFIDNRQLIFKVCSFHSLLSSLTLRALAL